MQDSEPWREKVARIIRHHTSCVMSAKGKPPMASNFSLEDATVDAIAALSPAPEGWRVVPVEPTFEMVSRGGHAIWEHASLEKHALVEGSYRAMIAAAPLPVIGGGKGNYPEIPEGSN